MITRLPHAPWILVQENGDGGANAYCERCGAWRLIYPFEADAFAAEHQHAAGASGGLGNAVAAIAKPIARLFGLEPDCRPCAERQAALNAATPRFMRR